jgi:hypothetical protein
VKWIPRHSDIGGNEEVDQEAKAATTLSHSCRFLTSEDAVGYVKKMSNINKPQVPKEITQMGNGVHQGNSKIPHRAQGVGTSIPLCQTCNQPRTYQHILLHYTEHTTARLTMGLTHSYKNGDETETLKLIIFMRDTGLISKLEPTGAIFGAIQTPKRVNPATLGPRDRGGNLDPKIGSLTTKYHTHRTNSLKNPRDRRENLRSNILRTKKNTHHHKHKFANNREQ